MDKNKKKKNKALRAASALFIAAMLTTSVVSGTYAKYVTQNKGKDHARVAAFGVVVNADGKLFSETYNGKPFGSDNNTITVQSKGNMQGNSDGNDKVVAPGTTGEDFKFSITGTPEVAVRVNVNVECTDEIFLREGEYDDVTGDFANDTGKFKLDADYRPIVWTLKKNGSPVEYNSKNLEGVKLSEINDYFTDSDIVKNNFEFAPNVDLSGALADYALTWEWQFGQETGIQDNNPPVNDKADTFLGNLAANNGSATTDAGNYNLSEDVTVTITVTQID